MDIFNDLPYEIKQEILLNIPIDNLNQYCKNGIFLSLCNDSYFLRRLAIKYNIPFELITNDASIERYSEILKYDALFVTGGDIRTSLNLAIMQNDTPVIKLLLGRIKFNELLVMARKTDSPIYYLILEELLKKRSDEFMTLILSPTVLNDREIQELIKQM